MNPIEHYPAADSRGRRTFGPGASGETRFPHPRQLSLLLGVRLHVQLLAGCCLLRLLALEGTHHGR